VIIQKSRRWLIDYSNNSRHFDGDEDPYTDAVEFWDFNTEGSWVGEQTPIIISRFSHDST
jgi:hypothetical protein